MTATFRVYGAEGHRQAESFAKSYNFTDWEGIYTEVHNSDITGTNEYTEVVFSREEPFDGWDIIYNL